MKNRPLGLTGRCCPCGALTDPGNPACHKCRARARWLRRKARPDDIGTA